MNQPKYILEKSEFIRYILDLNPRLNAQIIEKAYDFAKKAHEGQKRQSGEDYFQHVKECALTVGLMKLDTSSICAALLHDVIEDTKIKPTVISDEFGDEVLQLVLGVTKELSDKGMQNKRAENLRKVLLASAKDFRVIFIKLADRLHNMRTLKYLPAQSQAEIARETLEIYVPIAYKLGMYRIKSELEDLCLKHLQPQIYQNLKEKIAVKKGRREKDVTKIIKSVRKLLGEKGLDARVDGRAKNFYSIYKKMIKRGLRFEDIRDLAAVRILVDSNDDCYLALVAIHAKWSPIKGRFDDYIQHPKPNLYQSIHTEILFDKEPVEVQIRTHEMHHIAEEGIAAHWQYKDTERDKKFDKRIGWLKQILDWRSKESAQEFVDSFRVDIFKDEIYVLTPKGDPIPLPERSTPIDFAYAVHTEIGSHCKASKVNGHIQPLDSELSSGDVVEIITSKNSSPSRQWLKYARTGFAREKIRKAIGIIGDATRREYHKLEDEISPKSKNYIIEKCCHIRKGDKICGIKVKENIRVHSKLCEHIVKIAETKIIQLEWQTKSLESELEIEVIERTGIIADILSALTSSDVKIQEINTKSTKNSLRLLIKISSEESLVRKSIPRIKQIRDVISVNVT